jgi:D-aminopeptidase
MVCHGFKGGIGTSSRRVPEDLGGWTVGVLVQANHGTRGDLRVDGVPVGRSDRFRDVPLPGLPHGSPDGVPELPPGAGSIIVLVATDAPLLPDQCRRLATRAGLGVARGGGGFNDSSGDIFLAFATGNDGIPAEQYAGPIPHVLTVRSVPHQHLDVLFRAVIEATEESIVNALLASPTMTGANGYTAHGLDPELLRLAVTDAAHARSTGPDPR